MLAGRVKAYSSIFNRKRERERGQNSENRRNALEKAEMP